MALIIPTQQNEGSSAVRRVRLLSHGFFCSLVATMDDKYLIAIGVPTTSVTSIAVCCRCSLSASTYLEKIDVMRDQAFETSGAIRALQQSSATQTQILSDHETRVRVLEAQGRQSIAR
jgi:hypothetical protein